MNKTKLTKLTKSNLNNLPVLTKRQIVKDIFGTKDRVERFAKIHAFVKEQVSRNLPSKEEKLDIIIGDFNNADIFQ